MSFDLDFTLRKFEEFEEAAGLSVNMKTLVEYPWNRNSDFEEFRQRIASE